MNTFYPDGMEAGEMQLPLGQNFGRLPLNVVRVFIRMSNTLAQSFKYKGHSPTLYIDMEKPRTDYKFMNGPEVHLGITGEFELEKIFSDRVKMNRLDIYFPISEIDNMIKMLENIRRKK